MSWTETDKNGRRIGGLNLDKNIRDLTASIRNITKAYEECKHVNGKYTEHFVMESSDGLLEPWVREKCSKCRQVIRQEEAEFMWSEPVTW